MRLDACSLTTEEDMTTALGQVFKKGPVQPPSPYATVSACRYQADGVSLGVRTETLDKNGYNMTKSNLSGGEDVPGLGDAAYFHALENMKVVVGTLLVLKGKTMLSLKYSGLGVEKAKALAAEKALAARLLPKM